MRALFSAWQRRRRNDYDTIITETKSALLYRLKPSLTRGRITCKRVSTAHWLVNPFAPKSDQCKISPAVSPEILHHSMKSLAFHSGLRWKVMMPGWCLQLSLSRLYISQFLNSEVKGLTLSFPRVINVKFLLQPQQKYYIPQYGEFDSALLTQMKDDYYYQLSLPHLYVSH